MGVIHVFNKYNLNTGTWDIASNNDRFRSFAMADYRPIINSETKDINYIIFSYGVRVEDYSKDSINIKDKCGAVSRIAEYFAKNNNNNNFRIKFVFLDADAPLVEQSKKLASYIDELAKDLNVKSVNLLGHSKCGAMNVYVPAYFNNLRSFAITNIYNVSTPYRGTLMASPAYFYPELKDLIISKLGDNIFSNSIYKNAIKFYESISSNSHMDYDIAKYEGIPEDKYDRYDEGFIGNLLSDQNIYALKHINSFHNITTKLDENALRYAYRTGDVVTIGLHLLDKQFFNGESDGLVNVKDQR